MTLNEWFLKNNKFPLIVLSILFVVVQVFFILYYLKSNQENQVRSIESLITNIATVGVAQQNRPLLESTFQIAIEELGARSILLCKDDKVLYSFPMNHRNCNDIPKPQLSEKLVHSKASGFKGHSYYFYIPRFRLGSAFVWMLTIPTLLLIVFFFFVFRLQRKLNDDILKPLEKDLLTDGEFIISRFNKLREKIKQFQESKEQTAVASAIVEERFKISHNIRSLVQSMTGLQSSVSHYLPESKKQQLVDIVTTLKDILVDLITEDMKDLSSWTDSDQSFEEHMKKVNFLPTLVDLDILIRSFVRQKKSELKSKGSSLKLRYNSHENHAFVQAIPTELKSILSNLVNNSLDVGADRVELSLVRSTQGFSIEISDDGRGVPTEIRPNLFKRGFSFDKEYGTGYGLYHARMFLESWKGSIILKTPEKGDGACFEIAIPAWEPTPLFFEEDFTVVALDDDDEVHDFWREKLATNGKKLSLKCFRSPDALREWIATDENISWSRVHFFIDSDLGEGLERGEQLIKDLGIAEISTLVSHRFDDMKVLKFCQQHDIKILPKPLLPSITFNTGSFSSRVDVS